MVTDFLESNYNTVVSYYEIVRSNAEDEMVVWTKNQIADLRAGVQRNSIKDSIAICLYSTIVSLTGDPDIDGISYENLRNVIHNFNLLTNSTLDINFR